MVSEIDQTHHFDLSLSKSINVVHDIHHRTSIWSFRLDFVKYFC